MSISGVAPDAASFETAAERIRAGLPKPMELKEVAILPPRADPYEWAAAREGQAVILSGVVPNAAVRDVLKKAVAERVAGATLTNSMTYASGEPDNFVGAVSFALDRLRGSPTARCSSRGVRSRSTVLRRQSTPTMRRRSYSSGTAGGADAGREQTHAGGGDAVYLGRRTECRWGVAFRVRAERTRPCDRHRGRAAGMPNVAITDNIRVAGTRRWTGSVR